MATAIKEIKITITLIMNEIEAKFLRDLTQNRIVSQNDITEESWKDQSTRESIFTAIDKQLRKRK